MLAVHVCWGILLIVSANEGRNCYSHAQTPFASTSNFAGRVGSVSTTGYERYISRVGALAVALGVGATGLGLAPTANATCASIFGIGNSAECTSTLFSGALAIGDGAEAHADGLFGAAFVVGNSTADTSSGSVFNLATSLFGDGNTVTAGGPYANFATNIGGSGNTVTTQGSLFNTATNILGSGNTSRQRRLCELGPKRARRRQHRHGTGGVANWARNAFGDSNTFTLTGGNVNTARNIFGSDQHLHDNRRLRELCSKPVRRHKHPHDTAR